MSTITESTHTAWVEFFLFFFPPLPHPLPVTRLAREVPTHSWHIGLCSSGGQGWGGGGWRRGGGRSPAPPASPPRREVSGSGGVLGAVARIASCTGVFSLRARSQIRGSGVTAPPSFCQTAGKEVNESTGEEECGWGKCQEHNTELMDIMPASHKGRQSRLGSSLRLRGLAMGRVW